jgi:hypothetical protein
LEIAARNIIRIHTGNKTPIHRLVIELME